MADKYLIAGNWKMNLDHNEAASLISDLKDAAAEAADGVDVLVCPPFTSLTAAVEAAAGTSIQVGAVRRLRSSQGVENVQE